MSKLSNSELSAFQEPLAGLTVSLAMTLSDSLNNDLTISVEQVTTVAMQEVMTRTESMLSTVFSLGQPFGAESLLLLSLPTALVFADLMAGKDGNEPEETLDEAQLKLLTVAMQSGIRGVATLLAARSGENVEVESCNTQAGPLLLPPVFALDGDIIEARLSLSIAGLHESEATLLVTPEWARNLAAAPSNGPEGDGLSEDDLAAMLNDIGGLGGSASGMPGAMSAGGGNAPPFANFPTSSESVLPRGMGMIMDIPLDVTVELGRVRMLIKDVLELAMGSIVELDRVAGEPVDLLVNGRLVAKGEVVVIEDNFGIRLTEIVSHADRLAGLGKGR